MGVAKKTRKFAQVRETSRSSREILIDKMEQLSPLPACERIASPSGQKIDGWKHICGFDVDSSSALSRSSGSSASVTTGGGKMPARRTPPTRSRRRRRPATTSSARCPRCPRTSSSRLVFILAREIPGSGVRTVWLAGGGIDGDDH